MKFINFSQDTLYIPKEEYFQFKNKEEIASILLLRVYSVHYLQPVAKLLYRSNNFAVISLGKQINILKTKQAQNTFKESPRPIHYFSVRV